MSFSPLAGDRVGERGGSAASAALPAAVTVRAARIADMVHVEPLINGFAKRELMLPKTLDQLCRNFREFVVAVDEDDRVVARGQVRLQNLPPEQ